MIIINNYCFNCFRETKAGYCPYCGYKRGSTGERFPLALPEGSVLNGRYIVGRVLGQGGFGITYVAQDYKTKELVAIKEYFPDSLVTRSNSTAVTTISADRQNNFAYGKECFLNESKTLSQFIGNPNIVQVLSYFEENNTAYFAMEFLNGRSFLDYFRANGVLSWADARKLFEPVLNALEFVHSKGVVHRDISPDNIFLCNDGTVKLIDFGAARYSLGDRSQSLSVVLKHGYAPKEQYSRRGRQGPYTDIYALSATMYRALTGKIPSSSIERMDVDDLILPSRINPKIPPNVEAALIRGLSIMPEQRYRTVAEFRRDLFRVEKPAEAQKISCPYCGKPIGKDFVGCPYCKKWLKPRDSVKRNTNFNIMNNKKVPIALVVAGLLFAGLGALLGTMRGNHSPAVAVAAIGYVLVLGGLVLGSLIHRNIPRVFINFGSVISVCMIIYLLFATYPYGGKDDHVSQYHAFVPLVIIAAIVSAVAMLALAFLLYSQKQNKINNRRFLG